MRILVTYHAEVCETGVQLLVRFEDEVVLDNQKGATLAEHGCLEPHGTLSTVGKANILREIAAARHRGFTIAQ